MAPAKANVTLTVHLDPPLAARVEAEILRTGLTKKAWVQEAIEAKLEAEEGSGHGDDSGTTTTAGTRPE